MKKAQAWYIDYAISFIIFILAIFTFLNYSPIAQKDNSLALEAEMISEILMKEGIPDNWYEGGTVRIGLTTDGTVDDEKLSALSVMDYDDAKLFFPSNADFVFSLNTPSQELYSYGPVGMNISSEIDEDEIVAVKRIVVYKGQAINLEVRAW